MVFSELWEGLNIFGTKSTQVSLYPFRCFMSAGSMLEVPLMMLNLLTWVVEVSTEFLHCKGTFCLSS